MYWLCRNWNGHEIPGDEAEEELPHFVGAEYQCHYLALSRWQVSAFCRMNWTGLCLHLWYRLPNLGSVSVKRTRRACSLNVWRKKLCVCMCVYTCTTVVFLMCVCKRMRCLCMLGPHSAISLSPLPPLSHTHNHILVLLTLHYSLSVRCHIPPLFCHVTTCYLTTSLSVELSFHCVLHAHASSQ